MKLLRLIVPLIATAAVATTLFAIRPAPAPADRDAAPATIQATLSARRTTPFAAFISPIAYHGMEPLAAGRTGDSFTQYDPVKDYGDFTKYPPDLLPSKTGMALGLIDTMRGDYSAAGVLVLVGGILVALGFASLGTRQHETLMPQWRGLALIVVGALAPMLFSRAPSTLVLSIPVLVAGIAGLIIDARRAP